MLIDGDLYRIFGYIDADHPNEKRPLHVLTGGNGENVVVGDQDRKRLFIAKDHGSNTFSFKLEGTEFFIGFDQQNNILMLVSTEVRWKVNPLEDKTEYEVFMIDHDTEKYWEMNSNAFKSTIKLMPGQPVHPKKPVLRPPKQKWKFVRVETGDGNEST